MLFRTTYNLCIIVKVTVVSSQNVTFDLYNRSILLLQFLKNFPHTSLAHFYFLRLVIMTVTTLLSEE
jgi:hypothetical protein